MSASLGADCEGKKNLLWIPRPTFNALLGGITAANDFFPLQSASREAADRLERMENAILLTEQKHTRPLLRRRRRISSSNGRILGKTGCWLQKQNARDDRLCRLPEVRVFSLIRN